MGNDNNKNQIVWDTINCMVMLDENLQNQAIKSINPDTKRRIEFPNGEVCIVENRQVQRLKDVIRDYIRDMKFEVLIGIKKYHLVPSMNIYRNHIERSFLYGNFQKDKEAVDILRAKLKGNMDNESVIDKSLNEYVCSLLGIDNIFEQQQRVQPVSIQRIPWKDLSKAQKTSSTVQPTTLFNNEEGEGAIEIGRPNLLYSSRNVGKSYLAIEVAKSQLVKNPLYIMLDDISDEQRPRITHRKLNDKITLIDHVEWEKRYNSVKNEIETGAHNQAIMEKLEEYTGLNVFRKIMERKNQIVKSLGFVEKALVGNVLLLDRIFHEAVKDKRDLIIIDSLQGLMNHINNLTYEDIRQITKVPVENKITLLLLHHENEQGKIRGSKTVLDIFPYVYRLRLDDNKLYLDTEKARSEERKTFAIERIFEDKYFATHRIIEVVPYQSSITKNNANLTNKIRAILNKHTEPSISFDLLKKELGDGSDGGIKNSLKELENEEDEGIVKKGGKKNGKDTWDEIIIVANEKTSTVNYEVIEEED